MNDKTILLLVDDDQEDQEIFDMALEKVGSKVKLLTANNGEEAIHLLLNEPQKPHYIFLDLNMPRMNGKQFLHSIKDHEDITGIPVVIYSTSSSHEDEKELLMLGARRFITKPDNVEKISQIISDVIRTID
jgi:CheY-like chemotaxis protein